MKKYFESLFPSNSVLIDDGMIFLQNPESPKQEMITAGYFGVAAKLDSLDNTRTSYLVKVLALGTDKIKDVIISAEDVAGRSQLISQLSTHGIFVQDSKKFYEIFKESVVHCIQERRLMTSVNRTGWFAERLAYSTGNKILARDDDLASQFLLGQGLSSNMRSAGTLDQWQEHVLAPCTNNPMLLTAILISLSSLLLGLSGVGSRWVHWFGQHGKGKTTLLQCAASVFGNGIDPNHASPDMKDPIYTSKMNASQAGIEATLAGHFHRPFVADELGEGSRLKFGELVYLASANKGTITALSNRKVAKTHEWQTVPMSSGEVSMADRISEKESVKGGHLDRAIDIPTDEDIFFDIGDADDAGHFAGLLKDACATYYGTAAEAFILYLIDHPEAFSRIQKEHLQSIEDELTPDGCSDGAKRVVRFFANSVLVAIIAIEADILLCDQEHVMQAFRKIVDLWWGCRETLSPEAWIAKGIANNLDRIVEIKPPAELDSEKIYFIKKDQQYCMTRDLFHGLFKQSSHASIKSLVEKRILIADENNGGRLTRRHFYGHGKSHALITINGLKIEAELEKLAGGEIWGGNGREAKDEEEIEEEG